MRSHGNGDSRAVLVSIRRCWEASCCTISGMPSGFHRLGTASGNDSDAAAFIGDMQTSWLSVTLALTSSPSGGLNLPTNLPASLGVAPREGGGSRASHESSVRLDQGADDVDQVLDRLIDLIKEYGGRSGAPFSASFHGADGETSTHKFRGSEAENATTVDLIFEDQSAVTISGREPPEQSRARSDEVDDEGTVAPPDHPSRWLEPIDAREYGSLEVLIGELQKILDDSDVDEETRARVQGAIDVLKGTHRSAKVGETQRGEILAVVKNVVRLIATRLPTSIVLWDKAIDVLGTWYPSVVKVIETVLG